MAFIFSEEPQKRSLECLYDLWLAGILIWGSLDHIECHVGALDHVIDLMVIWGPVEAFLQPVPLLMTLLGAL